MMKMRQVCGLLLAACLLAACKPQTQPSASVAESAGVPEQTLSEDAFSMQVQLQGRVYSLPCPADVLEAAGWQSQVPENEEFESGEYADITFENQGAQILARIGNLGDRPAVRSQCSLIGFVAGPDTAPMSLAGGGALGLYRDQVVAAYGAPDGYAYAVGGLPSKQEKDPQVLRYTLGRSDFLVFTLDRSDRVSTLEIQNIHPLPPVPDESTMPADVLAYQPPQDISPDWSLLQFSYGGDFYSLPVPVYALLQKGWHLKEQGQLEPGEWLMGVSLQKGNQVLRTKLYNPGQEPRPLAACYLTMVESSKTSMNLSLALPGGIHSDSTQQEILDGLGEPSWTYQNTTALNYRFDLENASLVARFHPQDLTLFDLELEYYPPQGDA